MKCKFTATFIFHTRARAVAGLPAGGGVFGGGAGGGAGSDGAADFQGVLVLGRWISLFRPRTRMSFRLSGTARPEL